MISVGAAALTKFLDSIWAFFKYQGFRKIRYRAAVGLSVRPGAAGLNCRVKLAKEKRDNSVSDTFVVEICGSIHASSEKDSAVMRVFITDTTEGSAEGKPVHTAIETWQLNSSPIFCYAAELGKLPHCFTTLTDWVPVARIRADWLDLPRKGKRNLQFRTLITSRQSGKELAQAACAVTYENSTLGYVDIQENIARARTLAVPLALTVSARHKTTCDGVTSAIENWTKYNIDLCQTANTHKLKRHAVLSQAIRFFPVFNRIYAHKICKQIAKTVPLVIRCGVLELCLNVVRANGTATAEKLALLKKLAGWLEVGPERFRSMMEKIIPVSMHEVEDIEITLGITPGMDNNQTRQRLNKEYRKWNARATNFNPDIQAQAGHMLQLIAKTRCRCAE